jgi:hypothetical protein
MGDNYFFEKIIIKFFIYHLSITILLFWCVFREANV